MKLAAIAKLIKADGYCKLYKVFYDDCRTYDLYIGTKTAIFPLTDFRRHKMKVSWQPSWASAKRNGQTSSLIMTARMISITSKGWIWTTRQTEKWTA